MKQNYGCIVRLLKLTLYCWTAEAPDTLVCMNQGTRKSIAVLFLFLTTACTSTIPLPTLTPWPTYTPASTYTPFPIPITPSLPEPTSDPEFEDRTALIQEFIAATFRVVSVTRNPYGPNTLIVAARRAPGGCGDPAAPVRCYPDETCGSLYTAATCYFFVEPTFEIGAVPETRFIAAWPPHPGEGSIAALQVESIRFLDAKTVEFKAAGADGPNVLNVTYRLDLETGEINAVAENP